jgi:hypothetical protein
MARDGQQQLLSAHLEKADPTVFNIIEQVCFAPFSRGTFLTMFDRRKSAKNTLST